MGYGFDEWHWNPTSQLKPYAVSALQSLANQHSTR